MRRKRILMALPAGLAIVAGAAFAPTKEAKAEGGYTCFTTKHGSECGCPQCWLKNCDCPASAQPIDGGS